ncbi:E3 ubiquitin-protein ligase TRIM39-like [Acanthochromis polyacanthus]|uniref:E3 ubiquitin-protein ligase TRIM39-like n=1 Tax=Acanthochromis polyacanthus TaxID=80966 RepID=A0A3Q1G540_9TELE|nr:E3 ubiquitin-protein ligase TRIM39-like [Acanthochromis polyacanthus]
MASATRQMTEENFLCSICLSMFTKPVSIPCGHNFCLQCITDYWSTLDTVFQCPLCNEKFYNKPMLRVNAFIAEMAAQFKTSPSHSDSDQAENEDVLCALCTGTNKLPALKSCLVCLMSFCQTHLHRHINVAALKKHKLIDPVANLESRMCKKHDEPLELFCKEDQMFLCKSCKDSDHKTHKIVTLEEEAQTRKTELGLEKKDTNQLIQERQKKILEIRHSVEASRNTASKALSCSRHVMTAVVDYMKRSQAELTEVIETRQKKNETEAEDLIKELEGEIMQIKQKDLQLNDVLLTNDSFKFLENFLSLTIISPEVKDWSDVIPSSEQFPTEAALDQLEATITREITMLCDPNFKQMQRHAVDVTLDPDTANPSLNISEDGKQVTHVNQKRSVPNKPERFDEVLNVLAKEGFSSGKCYYEVQVKEKTQWDLGVAHESINRKGDIRLSPKNGYWTIRLRKGNELTANTGPAINLERREMLQKIGVFVDYEEGQVCFYDVDARARIFSFTGCHFNEKLFPFFSPCANDGGKNAAPLIITPVKHTS